MNASSGRGSSGPSSDALEIPPASGESTATNSPGHELPEGQEQAGAWRRLFARWIDLAVLGTAVGYAIGYLFPAFVVNVLRTYPGPGSTLVFAMVNLPLALILETLEYSVFGDTLGKNLLGIRVVGARQQKMGFGQYFIRNTDIWIRGFALGVPLISLFTMAHQAGRLRKGKQASWDERDGSRVIRYKRKWTSKLVAALGIILLVAVFAWLHSNSGTSPRDVLAHNIDKINATLPRMIGSVTRLEDVHLGKGNDVIYDYTITNVSSSKVDKHHAYVVMRDSLVKHDCNSRFVHAWMNNDWSFTSRFNGNDGKLITQVKVQKSDCNSR